MNAVGALDLAVIAAYLVGITAWGAWLGRTQAGGADYFLGSRSLPWGAVTLSVVATETSTLTFLSVPGISYLGSLTFMQLTIGYLLGRVVVALVFLPAYHAGRLSTAYELLETRFGPATRRLASAVFMVTRLLADSVRLFATAIPLALITGWPYPVSIGVIAALTLVYTYYGGIRAVVWVDSVQMGLYLFGAGVAIAAIQAATPGGWSDILVSASAAGKLRVLEFSSRPDVPYTFLAGVLGGALFTMASHGTDQLIVQRLLTCRTTRDSQKALIASGGAVALQFLLFLLVGVGLWSFYGGKDFASSDEIFARFIVEELPTGISGLLVACVFAAAMSSLSSSINSLASATAYDYWAPIARARHDERRILRAGRVFTLAWGALLAIGAIAFIPLSKETSAVEAALGVAAVVYGGLLGAFALGALSKQAGQLSAVFGIVVGTATVIAVRDQVGWLWYVPIGATSTVLSGAVTGWVASLKRLGKS